MIGESGAFDHWANTPWYNKDDPKAKFKIGERVVYCGIKYGGFEGLRGTWEVMGLNQADGTPEKPEFEYALRGFPFLVWEFEIEKVEQCQKK